MHEAKLLGRMITYLLGWVLLATGMVGSAFAQCQLNSPSGKIKHVVYIEFDNVHFTRDNPNVPSDLEQMPNLLNFIEQHGTLDAGDHTVLISHTANDILTTQTGLYSDDTGIFVANSFGVFSPSSTGEVGLFPSAFFYWTDKVSDINASTDDNTFALTTPAGQNVPAPWVPFTRAGCTVGAFSTANIVLERAPFDVYKVFGGPTSPQGMESSTNQNNDFIGASIHCALNDALCQSNPTLGVVGVNDTLEDEPGGYSGYQALFGLKYINPALTGSATGTIVDYHGVPLTGFNQLNFDPTPAQTLAVVEAMLKKGIPVVYAYIADAHDNQEEKSITSEGTFGPGEAPYVTQLADYNAAFGTFFLHLKQAGIDQSNTLFIFTPDEGDHFVGGAASPANCDGAKIERNGNVVPDVPCTYGTNGVGELDINLAGLTAAAGDPTQYSIHFDDAATTYVNGQPLPSSSSVRMLEQSMAGLSAVNPHTGLSESLLGTDLGPDLQGAIVDPAAMPLLHMNTVADPNREPTFTFFGNPNFFFETVGSTDPVVGTGFAWNHGDIQPEIARTFIGIVGPGVKNLGVTEPRDFFTDHVDLRPTMMTLLGLKDDYQHDGRTIVELLNPNILPQSLHAHSDTLLELGQIYKEINAPFGKLAESTLAVSTYAITSTSSGDAVYNNLENQISQWTLERDGLATQIKAMLEGAEFNGTPIDERVATKIILEGYALLGQAKACEIRPARCGQ
ncbi:MAG: hypothetical protein WB680_01370 [Candidatus Acidiferrales bacterium]